MSKHISTMVTPKLSKGPLGTWMPRNCDIGHRAYILFPNLASNVVNLIIDGGIWVSPFNPRIIREGSFSRNPRSEPDSGNPTVRDRKGASGNVAFI
jgi:hypothetical protein